MPLAYAYLSGVHPLLPEEELKALVEVSGQAYKPLARLDQLVILDADYKVLALAVRRAAYVREVGQVLWFGDLEELLGSVPRVAEELKELGVGSVRLEAASVKVNVDLSRIISGTLRALAELGVRPNLASGNRLRLLVSEGAGLIGLAEGFSDLGDVASRSPPRKPFWRSGELDLRLSRAMVNISRLREGDVFLDPFCGTGTLAVEAELVGASKSACIDIDKGMAYGSVKNFRYLGLQAGVIMANSSEAPLRDESVDAIATDPPYGRSTRMPGFSYEGLVSGFLEEAARVLRRGGYVVYAGPAELRPYTLAADAGLKLVSRLDQFVHSSLVRQIVVAKKV